MEKLLRRPFHSLRKARFPPPPRCCRCCHRLCCFDELHNNLTSFTCASPSPGSPPARFLEHRCLQGQNYVTCLSLGVFLLPLWLSWLLPRFWCVCIVARAAILFFDFKVRAVPHVQGRASVFVCCFYCSCLFLKFMLAHFLLNVREVLCL